MKLLMNFVILFVTSSTALGRGNESGGGGDVIRADFMRLGQDVIQFLATDPSGSTLADFHHLNIDRLEQTLTIDRISVTEDVLIDRTGSVVDAVVRGEKIFLNQARWLSLLNSGQDVRYLVFHEMLRLEGVDDDNYIVSRSIREALTRRRPLPSTTTRVAIVCVNHSQSSRFELSRTNGRSANFVYDITMTTSGPRHVGKTTDVVRMGDREFRLKDGVFEVDLVLDLVHRSARAARAGQIESGPVNSFNCEAISHVSGVERAVGFDTALAFIAAGL